MTTPIFRNFLLVEVPQLIKNLKPDAKPAFGVMTPQHMVEHLIYVTKVTMKRYGKPNPKMEQHHLGMKKFIESDRDFPRNVTPVNVSPQLKPLKYENLETGIAELPKTIQGFYELYEQNPDFKCYNDHMGELDFKLCERLHFKHFKHHFLQFALIENDTNHPA